MDIVGNFLNNLLYFKLEAEEKNALAPDTIAMLDSLIEDTTDKLRKIEGLDSVGFKRAPGNSEMIHFDA